MRSVRPSWVSLLVDGRKETIETGPRARSGEMAAMFSARINGASVPFLTVDAIPSPDGQTVRWVVTDARTGKGLFEETVPQ
jgi:hypothetical protein